MGLGNSRPLPYLLGGGPSDVDLVYNFLKQAVGIGGSAADGTIEAEWRLAKARGLSAAFDIERVIYNAFPFTATDFIPVYEKLLGIVPDPDASEESRRQTITTLWTKIVDATAPGLEEELQAVSSTFSLFHPARAYGKMTTPGRCFEDFDPNDAKACGPAFGGGRSSTLFPNYSSDFITNVKVDIPAGQITEEQKRLINMAETVLNSVLPAWVGYQFSNTAGFTDGFILDLSLLDLGCFNNA